jgi:hypothetical protein
MRWRRTFLSHYLDTDTHMHMRSHILAPVRAQCLSIRACMFLSRLGAIQAEEGAAHAYLHAGMAEKRQNGARRQERPRHTQAPLHD